MNTPRPRFSLGTATYAVAPGRDPLQDADLLRWAADIGIRAFDAARNYESEDGRVASETLLGRALAGASDIEIATKGGHRRRGAGWVTDNSPTALRSDLHTSLTNLGRDRIDLYYLHRADEGDISIEDSVAALHELKNEGLIDRIGLSNASAENIRRASAITRIDSIQNPLPLAGYEAPLNLAESLDALSEAERIGARTLVYSPVRTATGRSLAGALPRLALEANDRGVDIRRLVLRAIFSLSPSTGYVSGATHRSTILDAFTADDEPWTDRLSALFRADLLDAAFLKPEIQG